MAAEDTGKSRTAQHIAEAMVPPSPALSRAASAIASPPRSQQNTLALPTSVYTTYRQGYRPPCCHLTMTRLFAPGLVCDHCGRPGAWDWLYRCTQDREVLLLEGIRAGHKLWYDDLGEHLSPLATPATRGPEERSDRYSLLKEMNTRDMSSYTPGQVALLMKQREEVQQKIRAEHRKRVYGRLPVAKSTTLLKGEASRPWVPKEQDVCRATICHACRPILAERSYLSLDGVLKGDVPAEAALGWGFAPRGRRPVSQARYAANLGCRAVPMPSPTPDSSLSSSSYSTSTWSDEDFIEHPLETAHGQEASSNSGAGSRGMAPGEEAPGGGMAWQQARPAMVGNIPRASHSGFAGLAYARAGRGAGPSAATDFLVRSPWTPPPTPNPDVLEATGCGKDVLDENGFPIAYNGRSPASLKANPQVRDRVFSSMTPRPWRATPDGTHAAATEWGLGHPHTRYRTRHEEGEETYDDGLAVRPSNAALALACLKPLPAPDSEELRFFAEEEPTAMEEHELEEGEFGPAPLEVPHGVAVTEEGVEFGVADVITQV